MLLIVNPHASTVSEQLRRAGRCGPCKAASRSRRWTRGRPGTRPRCRARPPPASYDLVVALGGDGTVNEAANGLRGSSTPLSCLPGGSANVFGKLLGIPGDLLDATEHLLGLADDWRQRSVDLGVVNGRCFTFNSGLGLDAMVVEHVDSNPNLKARLGPYYYSWVAVSTFLRRYLRRPPRLRVAGRRPHARRRDRGRPERRHLHVLPGPPDRHRRRRRARLGGARRGRPAPRRAAVDAVDRLAGLLPPRPGRRPPPGHAPGARRRS